MNQLVHIKWVDSECVHGWQHISDVAPDNLMCETIGWVIAETEDMISIAATRSEHTESVYAPMHIPVCSILERCTIEGV